MKGLKIVYLQTRQQWAIPNPRVADRYWSVGQLVAVRTERINNFHYSVLYMN